MKSEERRDHPVSLRAFLYILIRDHITLGAVEQCMRTAEIAGKNGADFSNEHLRDYLGELMDRLNLDSVVACKNRVKFGGKTSCLSGL